MSQIMDLLRTRRSIRKFTSEQVPQKTLELLLEAGQLAPSRANSQPWRFVVVTDPIKKKDLKDASYNQAVVEDAPVLIVVLGVIDPRTNIPKRTRELVNAGCFGEDVKSGADRVLDKWSFSDLKVDAALNSSIAATQIMIAAHGLGLGSCWVKLAEDDKVLEILQASKYEYYHAGIIAIGFPDQSPSKRPRLNIDSIVSYEKIG